MSGHLKHTELAPCTCNVDRNSELQTLRAENMTPKQQLLNTQITREPFEGNGKKVLYMTEFLFCSRD